MYRRACGASLLGALLALTAFIPWSSWRPTANAAGEHAPQRQSCIFDHMSLRTAPQTCRPHARAYPKNVTGAVERAIYDSTLLFGVPYPVLLSIARCESGLNTHASNGTHFGLFQFAADTFKRGSAALRSETGIVARSYWKALDSSYVAGFLFATGQSLSWTCEQPSG
jgi:hypothetical protein